MMPILTRVTWISVWLWLLFCTCNEKQWQTEAWQLTRPGNCPPAAVPSAYHHISHFRNDAVYVNQYSTRDAVWKLSSKLREDVEESRKTTSSKASSKTVATSKPKATNLNTQPDRSELIRFVDLTNTSSWEVISRSFNSTTLRYLFFWQEEFNSLFLKAEQSLFQFTTNIVNKVQRDLRITQAIGDKFVRTVTQVSAEDFIPDLQRPMEEIKSSFASALLDSSSNMSSASLLSLPTLSTSLLANRQEKNRLISSFQSKNTKERAKAIKAKSSSIQTPAVLKALPASVSVVDSIYQSVRFMPKKLTYDYQRRLVRQLGNNLDSDSKQGRIRLLPSDISTSDATAGKVKKGTKQLEIGDVPLFVGMSSGAVDSFDDIDFEEVELDSEALEEQASSIPQDPELINVLMDYTMFISNLDELKFLQDVVNSTLSVIDVGESNEDLQVLLTIVEDWKTFTLAMLSRVESEPSTAERQPFVFVNVTDVAAASKGLVEVINRLEANNQIVDVRLDDALDLLRVLKTSLEGSMGKDVKVKREVGDDVEVMLSADKEVVDGKPSDSPKASTTQQILAFSPIFQNYSFVSSTMWSSVNGNSSSDSGMASTVEVSAVKVEASKESQLIATLVSALDVILFLLETLVKSVVPLFLDKGQTAMERIADTIEGSSWFGMNNYLRVKRWQGYSTLKNFK